MADVNITAELDPKGVEKGSAEMEKLVEKAARRAEQEGRRLDREFDRRAKHFGKFSERAGSVVDSLSANSATEAIGQQGARFAQTFGPRGEILAGVLALGGALALLGQETKDEFEKMIKGADDFREALDKTTSGGSIDQIADKLEEAQKKQDELTKTGDDSLSLGGILKGGLNILTGGKSYAEQQDDVRAKSSEIEKSQERAQKRIAELSRRELEQTKLKAAGQEDYAKQLEKEYATQDKIAKILQSKLDPELKAKLIQDAETASAIEEQAAREKISSNIRRAAVDKEGQAINDRAKDILSSPADRAKKRAQDRAEKNAVRRAAEEEVNKEDHDLRNHGGFGASHGLSAKDRADRIKARIDAAALNKKGVLKTEISDDAVKKIVDGIATLIPK